MTLDSGQTLTERRAIGANALFYTCVLVVVVIAWVLLDLALRSLLHMRGGTGSSGSLATALIASMAAGTRFFKVTGLLSLPIRKKLALAYTGIQIVGSLVFGAILLAVFGLGGLVGQGVYNIPFLLPVVLVTAIIGVILTYWVSRLGLKLAENYAVRRKIVTQ